jgi:hypothetical protein
MAASSNLAAAASHGFFSLSAEISAGVDRIATGLLPPEYIMTAHGGGGIVWTKGGARGAPP